MLLLRCLLKSSTISSFCLTFVMKVDQLIETKTKYGWPLNITGPVMKQKFFKATRSQEILVLLTLVPAIFFVIPWFARVSNWQEEDCSVALIRQYLAPLDIIYSRILFCYIVLMGIVSSAWHLHFMYFSWHVQLQAFMLLEYVKGISTS